MESCEQNGTGEARWSQEVDLEMIMAEHETGLLRYASRILSDPVAAQDVVQDTFIKLFGKLRNGAESVRRMKSWLYRVTHNNAVDYIKRESRLRQLHQTHMEERSLTPSRERTADRDEAMELALNYVKTLKPEEQQVVLLRLQEGLSYQEIAQVTGRSEGNVGCLLHHAVKKLSAKLKKAGALT